MTAEPDTEINISKIKLVCGVLILIISFLAPFSIPFIIQLNLSASTKAILSSLMVFGIPEIGMVLAVIVLGSEGYAYIKKHVFFWLRTYTASPAIQHLRYQIGITIFSLTLILGFLLPYISYFLPNSMQKNLYMYVLVLDLFFFASLFILGKEFWGKIKALFVYENKQL